LGQAIVDNAIAAAVQDHRFEPVELAELAEIEIRISILTKPQPDSAEAIAAAHKGVVLEQGDKAATYLPQVWESFRVPRNFLVVCA
jgi:AMMECR1 domain-containing protein